MMCIIIQSAAAGDTRLLDDYPSAAVLWATTWERTAYTGAILRARRSSDNAESDFYEGATYGSLNTVAGGSGSDIATWVGANDGFVVTLYDQSGNAINATQSTTTQQPKIVNSGSLLTATVPYMDFDGSNDLFNLGDQLDPAGSFSVFFVGKTDVTDSATFWSKSKGAPEANRISALIDTNTFYFQLVDSSNADQNITESVSTARNLYSHQFIASTSHSAYRNTTTVNTDSSVGSLSGSSYDFLIGAYMSSDGPGSQLPGYNLDGYLQLFVMYHADKSADRDNIRDKINSTYAVF